MYVNNNSVVLLVIVFTLWPSIAADHKVANGSNHRSNSIAHSNSNINSNRNSNIGTNGGIYFSDIPLSDAEGSADGPDDDLDDNASGKGEDDEDTKEIIAKEGSGSKPTDIDGLDLGSGEELPFIPPTERPTIRPDVSKTSVPTPTHESKESENKESIPNTINENRVPIDNIPSSGVIPETSTKSMVTSSTHWPHEKGREEDDNNRLGNEVSIMGQKQVTPASFFARPGILAAVIGGAVVGLLCAILLVMFIVYRMRKKDEGSYALDEPKRSTSANPYARGASKEFYA